MRAPVPVVVGILFVVAVIVVNFTPLRDRIIEQSPSPAIQEPIRATRAVDGELVEELVRREAEREAERQAAQARERDRQAAQARQHDARTVTAAEYAQLATGMSYAAAVDIIGFRGEELSRTSFAGTTTVMYQWTNPGVAGNMNAMFQNDRLVSKAQVGLR